MKLAQRFEKNFSVWFLTLTSFLFVILRFPSLFEPYWYADEGIYQAVGMLINDGAQLYTGAWDNKPPLLLIFYALFNSDQFVIRTISLIFGLMSVWLIYFIASKLFEKNKIAIAASTLSFAFLFGTRIIEGNIANTENLIILPILLGAYLIISIDKFRKTMQFQIYILAGFFLSLAFLSKIVAVFDFMALSTFLIFENAENLKIKISKKLIPFFLGFGIPVFLVILYFFFTNNFKDFMDAFLLSNVGYVGVNNNFIIPQGLLIFKGLALIGFIGFIFWKRNNISRNVLFVSLWFGFSLFSAFFSQRPYTHYLIMFLPAFCLMLGSIIANKKERIYLLILFLVGFVLIYNTFEFYTKLSDYYKNYIYYAVGKKDIDSYRSFFDKRTPRDYELASYIKENTKPDEKIFIWGNNAMVYKLAEKTPLLRYTVAYHITGFPEGIKNMNDAINQNQPKLIIIMPDISNFPLPLTMYNEKINIRGAKVYEKIF